MTDAVDPDDPRPAGHYGRFRDAPWYYVSDDLASTVMLGPATDAEPGDDWILSFSAEGEPRRTASGCVFASLLAPCMSCILRRKTSRRTPARRDTPPSATYAVNPSRSRKPSRTREANPYTVGVPSTPTAADCWLNLSRTVTAAED